MDERLLALC